MRIYLIGMPGCGKSTLGKALAHRLNTTFIDLDAQVERNALMFIDDIFEQHGESVFRKLETEALAEVNAKDAVIACGGGVVKAIENKALMQGLVVFLDATIATLESRIAQSITVRPLLKTLSLETLYKDRYAKYLAFSEVVVDVNGSLEEAITPIIQAIKERAV